MTNVILFADASNEQIGVFVLAGAAVVGLIGGLVSIASYFATRREVDDLKNRVDKIEDNIEEKTNRIHKRINRLLAGQMLIAGRVGCALDNHQEELANLMQQLESEED